MAQVFDGPWPEHVSLLLPLYPLLELIRAENMLLEENSNINLQ